MRLILIRHGETDDSRARRYCGFRDPPLNSEGLRQAQRLATEGKDWRIDKVYSSDRRRARQTAQLLFAGHSLEETAAWREMNFGLFEGLTHEQLLDRYPALYRDWLDRPEEVPPPGGEGLGDLRRRVHEEVSRLLSRHASQTVAVVTHGGPMRILLGEALPPDSSLFWHIRPELGAWSVIDYVEGARPVVTALSNISHPGASRTVRV